MIEIFRDDIEVPDLDSELFVLWLTRVIELEGFQCGDVNVIFVSDETLLSMNQEYLSHDYFTDIITFDYSLENTINGELYISVDRVIDNAKTLNQELSLELKRVCVHGVLHLCGYKDKSTVDTDLMRLKENFYLDKYVSRGTE